jgi:uncharacterized protein YaeQ
MAHPSTLYRFRIDLSDVDRGVYEPLDFRVAMHPSESEHYLLTRVLAFALNSGPSLEFSPGGLSDPDEPAIRALSAHGSIELWIEIGSPSARKLHRAAKAARTLKVYTYKDPELLVKEAREGDIHRSEHLEIFSFDTRFLDGLASLLKRDNRWSLLNTDSSLTVGIQGGEGSEAASVAGELSSHSLAGGPSGV